MDVDRVAAAVDGMDLDVVATPVGGAVVGGNADVDASGGGRWSGEVTSWPRRWQSPQYRNWKGRRVTGIYCWVRGAAPARY